MKLFSVMYQTSNSKGQERLAQSMVKWAIRLGHQAWLVTSIYHDGAPAVSEVEVSRSEKGYLVYERDVHIGMPVIRVSSTKVIWPPRRIAFRDFISTLRALDRDFGIDFIITHSTLWNGPEEASKWIIWKRLMKTLGEDVGMTTYAHMSHYQPPNPSRYSVLERTYRMSWNILALPSIFKAAHLVICLTGLEAEEMIAMGARPEQVHLFPGGLDDDVAALIDKARPDLFRDEYGVGDDKLIVAYLGTVEERKNPLNVVRVARKLRGLKDIAFVIAGRPGDQWNEVMEEARGLDNVIVTGELDEELKASLIKASHLNIILSKMEAFGLTQLEFMYAGKPVITSGVYGQGWLVRNGVDGIHVNGPDDIEGAAKAILALARDVDRHKEMGLNARNRAEAFKFSKLMRELLIRVESINRTL